MVLAIVSTVYSRGDADSFIVEGVYFDADAYELKIQTHSATTDLTLQLRYRT